ncbi:GtrA family protein [Lachnospiraceae bacterium 54-11]
MGKIHQFIKFGMVGVSNTIISYIVYMILITFGAHYLIGSIVGFVASVINAYYWNNKYVFSGESQLWWKVLIKLFLTYAGTGLVLHNILLIFWTDVLRIEKIWGPVINLFITVPINYLGNKYWAFRKNKNYTRGE